jgi:hypothetical protein
MSAESLQTLSSAAIALGVVLTALGGFGQHYFGKKAQQEKEAAQSQKEALVEAERTAQAASQAELQHRRQVLAQLRQLYVLSHDGLTPGMLAGTDPLPKQWTEEKLKERGETWRQDTYY